MHWLTLHKPQYSDFKIDQHALNFLPENGIPSDLPTFETKNDDKNSDQDSLIETELESDSDVVYNKDTRTSSFLPFQHNCKQEKEEIQEEIAKKILDWPSIQISRTMNTQRHFWLRWHLQHYFLMEKVIQRTAV